MEGFPMVDEACPHAWDDSCIRLPPAAGTGVYKDDCAYCCHTNQHGDGVFVCMGCFTAVCHTHLEKHQALHPTHTMYVVLKQSPPAVDEEPVKDSNRLGVVAPPEYESHVVCAACRVELIPGVGVTFDSYERIVRSTSVAVQDAVKANHKANCKHDCPHVANMAQQPNPFSTPPAESEPCAQCTCNTNNWMCLTCGAIGCPRKEAGGNQHAILHYMTTGHPVVYKVGTIVEGHGDLYCYACDDSVVDAKFSQHMQHFGVNVAAAVKTSKTLGEMEYDITAAHDFNAITEAGATLVPKYGPGFTGLRNFGNTCYMASVLQCLVALPVFQSRFSGTSHRAACRSNPYGCHACQLERVVDGMLSGAYSVPNVAEYLNGITPRSFKKCFAGTHASFGTGDQQDAAEYLVFLLQEIHRRAIANNNASITVADPTKSLEFVVEQRTQCSACGAVEYAQRIENLLQLNIPVTPKVIPSDATAEEIDALLPKASLDECLSAYLFPSTVQGRRCSSCNGVADATVTQRFASFPDVLVINPRREYFDRAALTVKKLNVVVDVPQVVDLERLRSSGPQSSENVVTPVASTTAATPAQEASVDEVALATIVSMGIELNVAEWALRNTNGEVERAIDYVFSHPEGPPPSDASQATTAAAAPPAALTAATNGQPSYKLVSMISHMGSSAVTGHYVAHVADAATGSWALFNDEKVAHSITTPFRLASIYFYVRE